MTSRIFGRLARAVIGAVVLLVASMDLAAAQDRPGPAVEFAAGWVAFPDDGVVGEGVIGGAGRWYLLPRISVGPEIAYIQGEHHSHLMATGNVTWDVLAPTSGRPRRVTPFLVAGGGMFQTRQIFVTETYTSREGAFTAGGGVRALVSDRVLVGFDARIGWELHLRLGGLVGIQLDR